MGDGTLELSLLYDFFGELLTEKQRTAFDLYYNEDLSLSEISEICGISRQGVRDSVVKAKKALYEYEEKTGTVARFTGMRRELKKLAAEAERLAELLPEGEAKSLAVEVQSGIERLNDGI